jgi:hypothetical protein
MAFRISAATDKGSVVSVIVETPEEGLAKIVEFREDGCTDIVVRDMHGLEVDPEELQS